MSVKDFLVRTLAVKMLTSEKTIEAVVNHQFQSANEAMDLNNSVEIAGFGKFFFNQKKAIKRTEQLKGKIATLEKIIADPSTSDQKKRSSQVTIDRSKVTINELKTKITYED
jgi:nucleoid DNA-binding protein